MNQYSGMDSLPIFIETQCFKMGSCPIFHRKTQNSMTVIPKEEWKKKDLEKKNTRLSLIPLLHTKIVLLLIDIMRLLFFFHKTSVKVHTHTHTHTHTRCLAFFLVILIGLQHIRIRLHMTFIRKQSWQRQSVNKQTTDQTVYHHKHYFLCH